MSSFIVSKAAYMRAAVLIAGIQDVKRKNLVYDYSSRKWLQSEDYLSKLAHFYELNKLSVIEQYNDDRMEGTPPTSAACKAIFAEYRKKGRQYVIDGYTKDLIMQLRDFFGCCEYQTEKETYYFEMHMFFDRLLVALMPYLHAVQCDGWSDLSNL